MRSALVGLLVAASVGLTPSAARACAGRDCSVLGTFEAAGAHVHVLSRDYVESLRDSAFGAAPSGSPGPFHRYASTSPCHGASPSTRRDDLACGADAACARNSTEQGEGPPVALWRASVDRNGRPVDSHGRGAPSLLWQRLGVTCFPDLVPGGRPTLTMAQVRAAFHDTAFAVPRVHLQPEGDVTLVGLPTYAELRWPATGFAPGEVDVVDPARMSGFRVRIRPLLRGVTYVFGDGTTTGPTTSLGGRYPGGDVTHRYRRSGDYTVRADVTYAGQYRVAGGAWVDIPGTVGIRGTPQTLHVRVARARLRVR